MLRDFDRSKLKVKNVDGMKNMGPSYQDHISAIYAGESK
jgi:hypothetical protein